VQREYGPPEFGVTVAAVAPGVPTARRADSAEWALGEDERPPRLRRGVRCARACGVERHQNDKHRRQHEQNTAAARRRLVWARRCAGDPCPNRWAPGAFAGIGWRHRNVLLGLTRSPALVSGFLSLAS